MPPCPGALWSRNDQGVWMRGEESSNIIFQTLLFLLLFFFFAINLVWFLGRICNGSIMVAWTYMPLFCVTTDAYWRILKIFGFWHIYAPNFLSFILFAYAS